MQFQKTTSLELFKTVFTVTLFGCFALVGTSATHAQKKPKINFNKSQNPKNFSVPQKKIGVGYPSPYSSSRGSSYSRGSNFSRGSGATVDFRRPTTSRGNSYYGNSRNIYSRNNYNRSRGGVGISLNVNPYSSFGVRSFGTSSFYRPTYGSSLIYSNGLGIGTSRVGTSFYSPQPYVPYNPGYGVQPVYPSQYNPGYATPQMSPALPLSDAEQAARTQLYSSSQPAPATVSNQFYARIPTSAAARSFQTRAEQAFKSGDYGQAADLAEKATTLDSINGKLRLFASQTNFALGNYSQAISHLDYATRSLSKDQWSYVVKNFKSFYGKNDYVSQTDQLSQRIANRPSADLYALRGYHYGSLGYPDAATSDFQTALGMESNHSLANRLMSVLGNGIRTMPEDIQSPVPVGRHNLQSGLTPVDGTTPNDGIIRLVPQADSQVEGELIPVPVPDPSNLPSLEIPVDSGQSILLNGPTGK